MKKFFSTRNWSMIFIFILYSIVTGCIEDDDLVPVISVPKPDPVVKVNAYASPNSIPYAGTTTIYWNTSNVASATVNNISIPTNGSWLLEGLVSDTTFTFKFISSGKKTEIDTVVTVKVGEPIIVLPTRTDTLCSRYWMRTTDSKYFYEGTWNYTILDEDRLTRKTYFYKNGSYEVFKKDGSLVGNGYWNWITKDSIKISGGRYAYELTDTTFIISERDNTIIDVYKGYHL